jgi:anti-anti-sigma regulatory factor
MKSMLVKVDRVNLTASFQEALTRLDGGDAEMVLDFSAVDRIDPGAIQQLEQLAAASEDRGVKVVLRGVNVDIYKVFKLVKLAPRFSFER